MAMPYRFMADKDVTDGAEEAGEARGFLRWTIIDKLAQVGRTEDKTPVVLLQEVALLMTAWVDIEKRFAERSATSRVTTPTGG